MFKPIVFISKLLPFITLLLTLGCSTSREFAGDGRFVKRSLRPGWHVDLGIRKNRTNASCIAQVVGSNIAEYRPDSTDDQRFTTGPDDLTASTENDLPLGEVYSHSTLERTKATLDIGTDPQRRSELQATWSKSEGLTEQEFLMPKKKWNHWAIPSFLAALATVFLAFTTLEFIAVIVGIVVTLTLAGIALRRGRVHELAGKGFAIAALLIGVLAALVTVISVASYGL